MVNELHMKNALKYCVTVDKFSGGCSCNQGLELWGRWGNDIFLMLRLVLDSLFVFKKVKAKTRKKNTALTMMGFHIKHHM